MGRQPLSVAGFRQMCGRAGRLNLDTNGEAFLIAQRDNTTDLAFARRLICADIEPLRSALHVGAGGGVEKLLLEMICCGRLRHEDSVEEFIRCTLMWVQQSPEQVHT